MTEFRNLISNTAMLHESMADAIGNPKNCWCRECGSSVAIDAANCLRHGWPKCCGYAMTIDDLSEEAEG